MAVQYSSVNINPCAPFTSVKSVNMGCWKCETIKTNNLEYASNCSNPTIWTFYILVIVTKMITSIIIMELIKCAQNVQKVLTQRPIFGKISSQIAHKKITCTMYFLLAEMFRFAHLVSCRNPNYIQTEDLVLSRGSCPAAFHHVFRPLKTGQAPCLWGSAAQASKAITAGQCGCRQCRHLSVLHRLISLYCYF